MHNRLQTAKSIDEVGRMQSAIEPQLSCFFLSQSFSSLLISSSDIDHFLQVIEYHEFFLEKCLRECLLLSPVLLKVCKIY